jgi:hypothetical protein
MGYGFHLIFTGFGILQVPSMMRILALKKGAVNRKIPAGPFV